MKPNSLYPSKYIQYYITQNHNGFIFCLFDNNKASSIYNCHPLCPCLSFKNTSQLLSPPIPKQLFSVHSFLLVWWWFLFLSGQICHFIWVVLLEVEFVIKGQVDLQVPVEHRWVHQVVDLPSYFVEGFFVELCVVDFLRAEQIFLFLALVASVLILGMGWAFEDHWVQRHLWVQLLAVYLLLAFHYGEVIVEEFSRRLYMLVDLLQV